MRLFTQLYTRLDETNSINRKIDALVTYFQLAPPEDAIWAVSFLIGRRPKRLIPVRKLQQWAAASAGIPDWLFEASYDAVGDLAETIALVLPPNSASTGRPLHRWIEDRLLPLGKKSEAEKKKDILDAWSDLDTQQRFVWNKLITGGFRVGVSRNLVVRALSKLSGIDSSVIAHRLMGHWDPSPDYFHRLLSTDTTDAEISRPYPFYLAHPLADKVAELGDVTLWQVEWKWDGIRAQAIHRRGRVFIWSRGEDLVTEKFPEVSSAVRQLPDGTVVDGELLGWQDGRPLDFGQLQKRIGRKNVTKRILTDVPVRLMVYDLLEFEKEDVRTRPLAWRSTTLREILAHAGMPELMLSPRVDQDSWEALALARNESRQRGVEGLMLKHLDSLYGVGRKRGDWWKWKVDPFTVDAVMIYAQRGHGRRAGLYTDYTLAVWQGDALVTFAKAYSGLSDAEIRQVDRFVQRNTIERYGPVRAVKPELVFEIAFEGIRQSKRHKSGVAVRFPRIARWRRDKKPEDADTLDIVKSYLNLDPFISP